MENNTVMPPEGGVMKEVLSTPFVKDIIRSNLQNIKPDKTHPLVNTLFWQDSEVILSVLGSIPNIINSNTGAMVHAVKQVNEKFTPEMLRDFLGIIVKDIDINELKALIDAYVSLTKTLWDVSPEFREVVSQAITKDAPPLIGKGINSAVHFLNEVNKADPQATSKFFSDVAANIDGDEFKDLTHTIANAFLDQKLNLFSWTWQLLRKRMKRRK